MVVYTVWVIYWPMTYRPCYMLRRSFTIAGEPPPGTIPSGNDPSVVHEATALFAWTLEDIRARLPGGLTPMGDPNPEIAEVWI